LRKIFKNDNKTTYGKTWQEKNEEWYAMLQNTRPLLHENFVNYLKEKNVQTILEIGCGAGVYPIMFKDLFSKIKYTGIDISNSAIEYCKKNSNFNFICGDIIKMNYKEKHDLIFSQAVIDHVYNIDEFLSKIVLACKKYAYISAYRGYFPNLKKHKMN